MASDPHERSVTTEQFPEIAMCRRATSRFPVKPLENWHRRFEKEKPSNPNAWALEMVSGAGVFPSPISITARTGPGRVVRNWFIAGLIGAKIHSFNVGRKPRLPPMRRLSF
ncbi:membrane protein [Anopheles sinensis]|uniref:Membrane protein n=1 Tax=Anopheles sinensis TaxID=74873 RepID=A0A084WH53_ANOSI|nr:membrane protein [Anopheles sinensis]